MSDEKREDGPWWVRVSASEWRCCEVMPWAEFSRRFGSAAIYQRLGLNSDQALVVNTLGIDIAHDSIEWGPYLGKGPQDSLAGLAAWLKSNEKMSAEEIAQACLAPLLDDIDKAMAQMKILDPRPIHGEVVEYTGPIPASLLAPPLETAEDPLLAFGGDDELQWEFEHALTHAERELIGLAREGNAKAAIAARRSGLGAHLVEARSDAMKDRGQGPAPDVAAAPDEPESSSAGLSEKLMNGGARWANQIVNVHGHHKITPTLQRGITWVDREGVEAFAYFKRGVPMGNLPKGGIPFTVAELEYALRSDADENPGTHKETITIVYPGRKPAPAGKAVTKDLVAAAAVAATVARGANRTIERLLERILELERAADDPGEPAPPNAAAIEDSLCTHSRTTVEGDRAIAASSRICLDCGEPVHGDPPRLW